jgi:hypothetical protein
MLCNVQILYVLFPLSFSACTSTGSFIIHGTGTCATQKVPLQIVRVPHAGTGTMVPCKIQTILVQFLLGTEARGYCFL